jgi:TonB family protein
MERMIFKGSVQANCFKLALVAVVFLHGSTYAPGQAPLPGVAPEISDRYIVKRIAPICPPNAKPAATVEVEFTITAAGNVSDVKVLDGPAMLQDAAVAAVKQWRFLPFLRNGQPAAIRTTARLDCDATPPPPEYERKEEEIFYQIAPLMAQCEHLWQNSRSTLNLPAAVDACGRRAELLDQLSANRDKVERLEAHDDYGLALLDFAHQPKEALAQFEIELALLAKAHPATQREYAEAYLHRGQAHMRLGEYAQAEQDFSTAENRDALAEKEPPEGTWNSKAFLKEIVATHLQLLEEEGKHDEAERLQAAQKP